MRPKYSSRAIILERRGVGEANLMLTLLTEELGLISARAQGARKSQAKLAASLATLAESDVMLVRGAEGWRVAGAALAENHFKNIPYAARVRAARVIGLYTRMLSSEVKEAGLYASLHGFLAGLAQAPESEHDALEIHAALTLLAALGLDAGEIPSPLQLSSDRHAYVSRVNRGIEASGL